MSEKLIMKRETLDKLADSLNGNIRTVNGKEYILDYKDANGNRRQSFFELKEKDRPPAILKLKPRKECRFPWIFHEVKELLDDVNDGHDSRVGLIDKLKRLIKKIQHDLNDVKYDFRGKPLVRLP